MRCLFFLISLLISQLCTADDNIYNIEFDNMSSEIFYIIFTTVSGCSSVLPTTAFRLGFTEHTRKTIQISYSSESNVNCSFDFTGYPQSPFHNGFEMRGIISPTINPAPWICTLLPSNNYYCYDVLNFSHDQYKTNITEKQIIITNS